MNASAQDALLAPGERLDRFWRNPVNLLVYFVASVPILVKLLCYPTYPGSDDAFIHLTIVRNVTHSLGWGINSGEPINLSSSPLYTVLLSLLSFCGLPTLGSGEVLSALAGFLALVFLYRLLVQLGLRPLSCLAGMTAAAFNLYLWRWNGIVMETTLSLFFLTLAYWCYHGGTPVAADQRVPAWRYLLTGGIVGLATLTRFELALALGCFGLCEMANHPPSRWLPSCLQLSAGFLVVIAPWFVFCHFYFHALLPTTFYAKTSSKIILWNPNILVAVGKLLVSGYLFPLLGVSTLLGIALRRRQEIGLGEELRTRLDVFLLPLVVTLFYYTKTPSLESAARYFLPALHLFSVVLVCLYDRWSETVPGSKLRTATLTVVAAHMVLSLGINQWQVAPVLSRFRENYWMVAQNAASYLKSHSLSRRTNVLVEVDIGMLSYYAGEDCYFIDGGALATPALRGRTLGQQVASTHPDFVVETLGQRVGAMSDSVPTLRLVWNQSFQSHSLTFPAANYVTNIYENQKP